MAEIKTVSLGNKPTSIVCPKREQWNDEKAIPKVQAQTPAMAFEPPSLPLSLAGRVEPISNEQILSPKEQLLAMDPKEFRAIEEELSKMKDHPPEPNYVIRVQVLIGKILSQFIQIAEKDRTQKKTQEERFSKANKEWGILQRETGDRGLNFTWISLALMGSQFLLPAVLPKASQFLHFDLTTPERTKLCQEMVGFFSREGCTNLSNMFNTETQSHQKQVDGLSQLAMAEMNAMMNKGSSDASSKDQFIRLLDEVFQSLKRAAQAG